MVPTQEIIRRAKEEKADIIGLSGLITPSLDEMVHVAKELEREGLKIPLLIGGATTSRIHTAVKIAPNYSGASVHVLDASRSVGVCSTLLNADKKDSYISELKAEYAQSRETHLQKQLEKPYTSLADSRAQKPTINWEEYTPTKPAFLGTKVFDNFDLEELVPYIDWTPFFHTWELRGAYPRILSDEIVGTEATNLFADAQKLLKRIVAEKRFTAKGVIGFWEAHAQGDDVILEDGTKLHFLRQQAEKPAGEPYYCLADFIAPQTSEKTDYIGAFAVSTGFGCDELAQEFEAQQDDYHSIMTKALADRLAEAFAEKMHELVRTQYWGYAPNEGLDKEALIKEKYQGIRPAPGYPACPDHTEKTMLFNLLQAQKNTGITLTESLAMYPTAAVSGYYFAHPQARYFGLGKITQEQVSDYAQRKNCSIEEAARWLSPNLAY
jgi:5-methyltetrahydrofolate--homocysteine methyltransferase